VSILLYLKDWEQPFFTDFCKALQKNVHKSALAVPLAFYYLILFYHTNGPASADLSSDFCAYFCKRKGDLTNAFFKELAKLKWESICHEQ
jgi:hypothetical protein